LKEARLACIAEKRKKVQKKALAAKKRRLKDLDAVYTLNNKEVSSKSPSATIASRGL
jgi:hypothetical protein